MLAKAAVAEGTGFPGFFLTTSGRSEALTGISEKDQVARATGEPFKECQSGLWPHRLPCKGHHPLLMPLGDERGWRAGDAGGVGVQICLIVLSYLGVGKVLFGLF